VRSTRLPWDPPENALAAVARAAAAAGALIDLTASNPTEVGLTYPAAGIAAALARAPISRYEPAPLGLPSARAAVAADYARAGVAVDSEQIVLTASSSESYGFLFKLCCNPGDAVLVPEPSYPLFEYLARLEGVVPLGYRLAFDGVWHVDFAGLDETLAEARRTGLRPRALVVVNPNNPTGSFLKREELARLSAVCDRLEMAIISDEVFAPYPFGPDPTRVPLVAANETICIAQLRGAGVRILATTVRDAQPANLADMTDPVALLIGNEGNGVAEDLIAKSDAKITIPCPGPVESLNAAMAATVLLYEVARQRAAASGGTKDRQTNGRGARR